MFSTKAIFTMALLAAFAACGSDDPTGSPSSPLNGLSQTEGRDSTGTSVPSPPPNATPGYFRGTVLGASTPGSGGDTLATAPRVAGVTVTAYPRLSTDPIPDVGAAVATVVTGADGKFQLPTLPGGEYVVTFTPPTSSIYSGVWVTTTAHSGSSEWPWWVVLPKK
jgi:hypothetical protein